MKKTVKKRAVSAAKKPAAKRPSARPKIREIMTSDVVIANPTDTLQLAAKKMQERDIGFLPICDGQRLIGTLSDRDIAVRAVSAGYDPRTTHISDFITPRAVWCFDDQDIEKAAGIMQENQIRRLMVLSREGKRLVGVVSLGDLAANGTKAISSEVLESTSPAVD